MVTLKSVVMTPSAPTRSMGFGHQRAELGVGRGDVGDRRQDAVALGGLGRSLERGHHRRHGKVDALAQIDGFHAALIRLDAALDQRVGEHDGRGGAVAGDLVGLHRHFADHLRAHVLETVVQLDLGGDADAVAGHHRRADRPVDHGVHAFGAERRLDGGGQPEDATGERAAGLGIVKHDLGHEFLLPPYGRVVG